MAYMRPNTELRPVISDVLSSKFAFFPVTEEDTPVRRQQREDALRLRVVTPGERKLRDLIGAYMTDAQYANREKLAHLDVLIDGLADIIDMATAIRNDHMSRVQLRVEKAKPRTKGKKRNQKKGKRS